MATTIVTDYTKRDLKDISLETLREILQEFLVDALGDEDKCDNAEDANFYEGQVSVLEFVLETMTEE